MNLNLTFTLLPLVPSPPDFCPLQLGLKVSRQKRLVKLILFHSPKNVEFRLKDPFVFADLFVFASSHAPVCTTQKTQNSPRSRAERVGAECFVFIFLVLRTRLPDLERQNPHFQRVAGSAGQETETETGRRPKQLLLSILRLFWRRLYAL